MISMSWARKRTITHPVGQMFKKEASRSSSTASVFPNWSTVELPSPPHGPGGGSVDVSLAMACARVNLECSRQWLVDALREMLDVTLEGRDERRFRARRQRESFGVKGMVAATTCVVGIL